MVAEHFLPAAGRFCMGLLLACACASVQAQAWTLESSIERATTVAPELRVGEAEVAARAGSRIGPGNQVTPTSDPSVILPTGLQA